ncbi:MAG: FAD-dependent oxidoreductase [Mycolicibacterium sp.]|uniref:FAD-dependent oxidoreductase n=1 Tax=Mycolicibacterium sp. TaxID=2320850 RepID=UPI003D0EE279
MTEKQDPLIVGAGPAGLTAALALAKKGVTSRLYEASGAIGGLARTPTDGDWRIDAGGHRFFTKIEAVSDLWRSLLPPDQWLSVPRSSAMLVDEHFMRYPLVGRDLVTQMGFGRGVRGLSSLMWSRLRRGTPVDKSANFREWGTLEFGRYWYEMFFDGYVRKTWVADPASLASDWANQRIRPIIWGREHETEGEDVFQYPRLGPGQVWEAAAVMLAQLKVPIAMNSPVVKVRSEGNRCTVELADGHTASGDALFSSMPLRSLVGVLDPAPPQHVQAFAAALKHRALITVAVALRQHHDIPFNWVYTPGMNFAAGRIQNYLRWSPDLAPKGWDGTYLGFEYYIGPDGELWNASDDRLTGMVERDLDTLGLGGSDVERIMIVRSQFAYPVHDPGRDRNVARIRDYLRQHHPSIYPMGRNGMHHYDNQDHAMLSAVRSVARYFGEIADPWQVNTARLYHETGLLKM